MRKTKIVCTLGPAVDNEEKIEELILNGMDCARLNFSHGSHAEQKRRMDWVRQMSAKQNMPVALLMDTKGPEIRVRELENGGVELCEGQRYVLDTDEEKCGDVSRVAVTYKKLAQCVKPGTRILIDDGKIELQVESICGTAVECRVLHGGRISNHKSINLPNVEIPMPYISPADEADILFGIREQVDYIAASFVRTAEDVRKLRKLLEENGGAAIRIISKIENRQGVENMEEIISESDGIMVARGDLGVEIPFERLPAIQKIMIERCNAAGKLVITATQMLESMITNPRPTRAEVSDVANAIYDGTTAVMLSGESAAGSYPIEAVRTMAEIVLAAEKSIDYSKYFIKDHQRLERNVTNAVCASAYSAAEYLDAKAIIVMTKSGRTARMLSSFRPACPVIAATMEPMGMRQLKLFWGIKPVAAKQVETPAELLEYALNRAKESQLVMPGDKVIAVLASDLGENALNDIMQICTI